MTMMRKTIILGIGIAALAVQPSAAQDELYLEITQPGLRRVAVAAPPLMVLPGTPAEAAKGFQETLDNDLAAAAPIAVVDDRLYALVEDDPRPEVLNQRWRSIGAQFLLSGTVVRAGGQLVVEARLVDLVSGEFAFAKRYRAGISASQVVAHTLSNDIVQVFTGRPGPFPSGTSEESTPLQLFRRTAKTSPSLRAMTATPTSIRCRSKAAPPAG
jgi:TolB-like protein